MNRLACCCFVVAITSAQSARDVCAQQRQVPATTSETGGAGAADSQPDRSLAQRREELAETLPLELPALSLPQAAPQTATPATGKAVVRGFIVDEDGALIQNAKVSLDSADGRVHLTTTTNSSGRYSFANLPNGSFVVTAEAPGLSPESVDIVLRRGQELDLAFINLPPASTTAEVSVVSSQRDAAEAELKQEEKQRLLGVLPNFYVSYNWHAAPLSSGQKSRLAYRSLIDPTNFVIAGIIAGVQLENNTFPGFGTGPAGFFSRFGAAYGNEFIGTVLGGAIFPIVFRQDPRYFYRGVGTVRSRVLYALAAAVVSRGDNGKWQPAYAAFAGDFSAGAIANLYYPKENQDGVGLTVANGFISIGSDALGNLVQEFVFKHITPRVPKYPPASGTAPTGTVPQVP